MACGGQEPARVVLCKPNRTRTLIRALAGSLVTKQSDSAELGCCRGRGCGRPLEAELHPSARGRYLGAPCRATLALRPAAFGQVSQGLLTDAPPAAPASAAAETGRPAASLF